MQFIYGVLVGGLITAVVMTMAAKQSENASSEKAKKIEELKKFVESTDEKITNDLVQEKLSISDATATRYLDELEKEKIVKQVGEEGRSVYYKKI